MTPPADGDLPRDLAREVLAAVEPARLAREALAEILDGGPSPFVAVFALGKGAAALARGAAEALAVPLRPEAGLPAVEGFRGLVARPASAPALLTAPVFGGPWEEWPGGHPLPDVDSMGAGHGLLRLLRALGPDDHLLALVSGGGSACCELPAGILSIADLAEAQRALLASGLPIHRINAVRKHLSRLKGGRSLGATAARVTALVLSDVPSDDPSVVASGPFAPDPTTYGDALATVEELARQDEATVPPAVLRHLQAGVAGDEAETLKPGDPEAARAEHRLLAGPRTAAEAAARWLEDRGYRVEVGSLAGEAGDAGRDLVRRGRTLEGEGPVARVLCGETTVHLGPEGLRDGGGGGGGRNQELALAAAEELARQPEGGGMERVLALATDGVDGPTAAAGAVVDGRTWRRLEEAGADPARALRHHASNTVLDRLGDALLHTGPTGTNVADLAVYLRSPLHPREAHPRRSP